MVLTERQRRLYDFLHTFTAEHGYCPTVREMAAGIGLRSSSNVNHHLYNLERMGLIEHRTGSARSWTRTQPPKAQAVTLDESNEAMQADVRRLLSLCENLLPGSRVDVRTTWQLARKTIIELRKVYGS